MPRDVAALEELPGIGRYTAGAIASMAGGERVPLVDGNVVRVLLRVDGREGSAGDRETMKWTWARAGELVSAAGDAGVFNEGLMELGAIVCTPRNPGCGACPLRTRCRARATGRQALIPAPKAATVKRAAYCAAVVVRDAEGRVLMEQRATDGMWAGMWEAPTLESADAPAEEGAIRVFVRERLERGARVSAVRLASSFVHQTTHRRMMFSVWSATAQVPTSAAARPADRRKAGSRGPAVWMTIDEARAMPISNAQRRVLTLGVARAG